jgi:hypothetical protein
MRNPYVTGPYVSGRRHYGRHGLLDNLLHGEANAYWVIGNRRIGKTSLLRQLEALALAGETGERRRPAVVPIFWDMQGCNTFASLGRYLADALQERFDQVLALGLPKEIVHDENLLTLLPALRRAVRNAGHELLLLCDETEVLINLAGAEPELAQRFHAELTRGAGLRVVAVSTRRIYQLHAVCASWPTSPFLAGFDMSQTLGRLDPESALALVTQAQANELVRADPAVIETICDLTNYHPYLIQLLCSRVFQPEGSLRPVEAADLAVDPLLGGFINNDFNLLSLAEQRLVWAVHDQGQAGKAALAEALDMDASEVQARVQEIEPLGYLRRKDDDLRVGNQFLDKWLSTEPRRPAFVGTAEGRRGQASSPQGPASGLAEGADAKRDRAATKPATPPLSPAVRDAAALIEQLNVKRARLVDLEVIRARDLLNVSPTVLAEIRQTEQEIQRLLNTLGVTV